MEDRLQVTTLAGGCFWCTEAIFRRLKGVVETLPGYAEGAEAVQVKFDPQIISFEKLLEVFFALHDPTTLNKQGADEGTQYRSAIFYSDGGQKKIALAAKAKIAGAVTETAPLNKFSQAEDYHKDYYEKNRNTGYCRIVIDPKITKLYNEYGTFTNPKL